MGRIVTQEEPEALFEHLWEAEAGLEVDAGVHPQEIGPLNRVFPDLKDCPDCKVNQPG